MVSDRSNVGKQRVKSASFAQPCGDKKVPHVSDSRVGAALFLGDNAVAGLSYQVELA